MLELDLENLPQGPLSMAALVGLDSAPLRRLLKGGLRRGLPGADLAVLLEQDWGLTLESAEAQTLLQALGQRGWFDCDGDIWKTHLG